MSKSTKDQNNKSDSLSTEDKLQSFITSIVFIGTADKAHHYGETHTEEVFNSLLKK